MLYQLSYIPTQPHTFVIHQNLRICTLLTPLKGCCNAGPWIHKIVQRQTRETCQRERVVMSDQTQVATLKVQRKNILKKYYSYIILAQRVTADVEIQNDRLTEKEK